jgi:hypothetical protein
VHPLRILRVLVLALVFPPSISAGATLALNRDFVKANMNRATIRVSLHVHHRSSVHSIKKGGDDGDIHLAVVSDDVRLPLVAEMMNIRAFPGVIESLKNLSADKPVDATGVWRIWFEHPGEEDQIQGKKIPPPHDSNPDHVFEIHPVTSFAGEDLREKGFVPIAHEKKLYEAYTAKKVFGRFEKLRATIFATDTAIMIDSVQVGYNYSHFYLEPVGAVKKTQDALFVLANVYDTEDPEGPVVRKIRMVFVQGSPPARALLNLQTGERLHVLGMPRVNLREVWEIVKAANEEEVEVALPYEMIVVGIYPEDESEN